MICISESESETATEGEEEIRARELRKQEVRVEPPVVQHTDTGSDTEVNFLLLASQPNFTPIPENGILDNSSPDNVNSENVSPDNVENICPGNSSPIKIFVNDGGLGNSTEQDIEDLKFRLDFDEETEQQNEVCELHDVEKPDLHDDKVIDVKIVISADAINRSLESINTPESPNLEFYDCKEFSTSPDTKQLLTKESSPSKKDEKDSKKSKKKSSSKSSSKSSKSNSGTSTPKTSSGRTTPKSSKNTSGSNTPKSVSGRTTPQKISTPKNNFGTTTPTKSKPSAIQNFIKQSSFDLKNQEKTENTPLLIIRRTPSKINLPKEQPLLNKPRIAPLSSIQNAKKYFGEERTVIKKSTIKIEPKKVQPKIEPKKEEKKLVEAQRASFEFEPLETDLEAADDYINNLLASEDQLLTPNPSPTKHLDDISLSKSIEDLFKALEVETSTIEDIDLKIQNDVTDEKIDELLTWMTDLEHQHRPEDRKLFRSYSDVKYKDLEHNLKTPKRSDSIVSKIPKDNIKFFEKRFAAIKNQKEIEDSTENSFIKLAKSNSENRFNKLMKSQTEVICNQSKIPDDLNEIKIDIKNVRSMFEKNESDIPKPTLKKSNSLRSPPKVPPRTHSKKFTKQNSFEPSDFDNLAYNSVVTVKYNHNLPQNNIDDINTEFESLYQASNPDNSKGFQESVSDMTCGLKDLLDVVEAKDNVEEYQHDDFNLEDHGKHFQNSVNNMAIGLQGLLSVVEQNSTYEEDVEAEIDKLYEQYLQRLKERKSEETENDSQKNKEEKIVNNDDKTETDRNQSYNENKDNDNQCNKIYISDKINSRNNRTVESNNKYETTEKINILQESETEILPDIIKVEKSYCNGHSDDKILNDNIKQFDENLKKPLQNNDKNLIHNKENILTRENIYDNLDLKTQNYPEPIYATVNKALKTKYLQNDLPEINITPQVPKCTRNVSASLENIANMKVPTDLSLNKHKSLDRSLDTKIIDKLKDLDSEDTSSSEFSEDEKTPVVPIRKRSNNQTPDKQKLTLEIKPELPPRKRTSSYAIRQVNSPDSPGGSTEQVNARNVAKAKGKTHKYKENKDCVVQ